MTATMITALTGLARRCQGELDAALGAWRTGEGAGLRLWCGPGCGNCCTLAVNASLAEALAIAVVLPDDRRRQLAATVDRLTRHALNCTDTRSFLTGYREAVGPCPFLDAGSSCTIYPQRPLACRALLATRPADWCGVNLAELADFEREAFLASLDRTAVAWPTHYAAGPQAQAAELERGLLQAMMRLTGFAVTGNLPLLVWLTGQPGCIDALVNNESFLAFAADHQVNLPFLVQTHVP